MQLLNLHSPDGTAWELFVVVVVIIAAPVLVERVRIPGLIGLLAGGCIIGPKVLGIVSDTTGILHELGEVGLLYLMFLAGLELDLGVFARYRNQAIGFMALTFTVAPDPRHDRRAPRRLRASPASVLLGSLFASYTLVAYPIVRNMGLAANRAVAATVGATVLTDTLALVILAFISGSTTGDASGVELILQVVLGLAILVGFTFGLLPPIARWFFRGIGQPRTLRYAFMLAALLSAGVVAEVVGIEGIVGAFFCGLALNRLVPNEGEFMERIEFFGSALLIPMFLVSIGTVIDPGVLVDPATLGLAAVFVVACIGGKLDRRAAVPARCSGYTTAETGRRVRAVGGPGGGHAGGDVRRAADRAVHDVDRQRRDDRDRRQPGPGVVRRDCASARRCRSRPRTRRAIGRVVLAHIDAPDDIRSVLAVAAAVAGADAGVVRPTYVVRRRRGRARAPSVTEHGRAGDHPARASTPSSRSATTAPSPTACCTPPSRHRASLVVVPAATQSWLPALLGAGQHALVAASSVPSALVRAGAAPAGARRAGAVDDAGQAPEQRRVAGRHAGRPPPAQRARARGRGRRRAARGPRRHVRRRGRRPCSCEPPLAWLEREGRPTDVVVVPGGRNGALSTARATKLATSIGGTILVAADRESVTTSALAAEGLGVVTVRPKASL